MNVTSGASVDMLAFCRMKYFEKRTPRIVGVPVLGELEFQPVSLVCVQRVGV